MIKLSALANKTLNRVYTTKLEVALSKLLPLLTDKEKAEIMLMYNKIAAGAQLVNSIPFADSTKYSLESEIIYNVAFPSGDLKEYLLPYIGNKKLEISAATGDVIKELDSLCYVN